MFFWNFPWNPAAFLPLCVFFYSCVCVLQPLSVNNCHLLHVGFPVMQPKGHWGLFNFLYTHSPPCDNQEMGEHVKVWSVIRSTVCTIIAWCVQAVVCGLGARAVGPQQGNGCVVFGKMLKHGFDSLLSNVSDLALGVTSDSQCVCLLRKLQSEMDWNWQQLPLYHTKTYLTHHLLHLVLTTNTH